MRLRLLALAAAAALLGSAAAATPIRTALTMDDLPAHGPLPPGETRVGIAQKVIAALKAAHLSPVMGFVNGGQIEREPASASVIDQWRAAGFLLGNHGWSHADLDQVGPAAFERDIATGELLLARKMPGQDWRWLRFPYLHEGAEPPTRAQVRGYLAEHGYRIAAVTMSFGDFAWNEPYARCIVAQDKAGIARLERSYLAAAAQAPDGVALPATTDRRAAMPYVLLMHIGAFDARMLPRLLALYRSHHVRFVALEQAERDIAYAADVDPRLSPVPKPIAAPRQSYQEMLTDICRGTLRQP